MKKKRMSIFTKTGLAILVVVIAGGYLSSDVHGKVDLEALQNKHGYTATKRKTRHTEFKKWKESPFTIPGQFSGMNLGGVLESGGEFKALIDGELYKVGDVVKGKTILSISKDKVVMESEGVETVFKME